MAVPKYFELFNPTLSAIRELGGSASNQELSDAVAQLLRLSDDDLNEEIRPGKSLFENRLGWARTYLKKYGIIDNSERSVWSLTHKGREVETVDANEVKRFVKRNRTSPSSDDDSNQDEPDTIESPDWKEELLTTLLNISPAQFERLCQRILRESGFAQVEVTGKTGDGGIDGTGTVKLGGLLSFPIIFQCKRHQGSVGPSVVRDFRGAMVGRADRGLILTTGVFTRDARKEAVRDGAPPIDLVDRDALLEKLRQLKLGLQIEQIEQIVIDEQWYRDL